MTLYEIICDLAQRHCRIKGMGSTDQLKFDLVEKNIQCGKGFIMQHGQFCVDWLDLTDGTFYVFDDGLINLKENPYELLENLYVRYRDSLPSKASVNNKGNFRAKVSDELTFEQLLEGEDRLWLQYQMEALILLGSLKGIFKWNDPKKWFWKSSTGLILYKSWLLNKEELRCEKQKVC